MQVYSLVFKWGKPRGWLAEKLAEQHARSVAPGWRRKPRPSSAEGRHEHAERDGCTASATSSRGKHRPGSRRSTRFWIGTTGRTSGRSAALFALLHHLDYWIGGATVTVPAFGVKGVEEVVRDALQIPAGPGSQLKLPLP